MLFSKKIIAFQANDKTWKIKVDGKERDTDYDSVADVREWLGCMNAHGMYQGYRLFVRSEFGALDEVKPTYKNPCEMPGICK